MFSWHLRVANVRCMCDLGNYSSIFSFSSINKLHPKCPPFFFSILNDLFYHQNDANSQSKVYLFKWQQIYLIKIILWFAVYFKKRTWSQRWFWCVWKKAWSGAALLISSAERISLVVLQSLNRFCTIPVTEEHFTDTDELQMCKMSVCASGFRDIERWTQKQIQKVNRFYILLLWGHQFR